MQIRGKVVKKFSIILIFLLGGVKTQALDTQKAIFDDWYRSTGDSLYRITKKAKFKTLTDQDIRKEAHIQTGKYMDHFKQCLIAKNIKQCRFFGVILTVSKQAQKENPSFCAVQKITSCFEDSYNKIKNYNVFVLKKASQASGLAATNEQDKQNISLNYLSQSQKLALFENWAKPESLTRDATVYEQPITNCLKTKLFQSYKNHISLKKDMFYKDTIVQSLIVAQCFKEGLDLIKSYKTYIHEKNNHKEDI